MKKLLHLPPLNSFDDINLLKSLNLASRALAELKGEAKTIPNSEIIINTLGLQESKESSEIENIITTQDDLYRSQVDNTIGNIATKEVQQYANALLYGYNLVKKNNLLTSNHIIEIQSILEPNKPGIRKVLGTVLKNSLGDVVYTPPQIYDELLDLMSNLEKYINLPEMHDIDPLIKMAIIHHQFESIHPFYDGNGRTGRIINVLYLVQIGLLDIPVLYLSRYINKNKAQYYKLLQLVRDKNAWNDWIIWMLDGVQLTSKHTILLIRKIKLLMDKFQTIIQRDAESIYSKELVYTLFKYPYTKIKFIETSLGVHRQTATKYLNKLVELNLLSSKKVGNSNYYLNIELFNLLIGNDEY